MEEKTWTIVQFTEDNSVEAIPTSWIQGSHCYWPPYRQEKLSSSLRKGESVNPSWPKHHIKIFRNATFDDYAKARAKSRVAEDCSNSDLYSSETDGNGKRKRVQKILSSSSSSEESFDRFKIPIAQPILRKVELKKDPTVLATKNVPSSCTTQESTPTGSFTFASPSVTSKNMVEDNEAFASFTPNNEATRISEGLYENNRNCCFQQEHQALIEIKNQNHLIRGILNDVLKEIKDIRKISNLATTNSEKSFFIKYPDIKFPIGSDEEFASFEKELENENNFNEAVAELAKFGGSNPYNFIKRTISTVLSDSILTKYSWLGRKGKRPLRSTLIARLFIGAADKSGIAENQKIVESAIQSYIKRGTERLHAKENKKQT